MSTSEVGAPSVAMRIAVVVSRFPKFTETFVINEILGLEALGVHVEIHPLLRPEPLPHQPSAQRLVEGAHYARPWGLRALGAFLRTAWRQPRPLLAIVATLLRDTRSHPPFLVRDLALVPRICLLAEELRGQSVQHVHAHFATHAGFAAWAVGRLTGLPYSIVAHGSDIHRNRAMLATKVDEAAFVATVSEFNRQVILAECGDDVAERVHVVRCGVATGDDDVRPTRPTPHEPFVVACVGTLHEVKGQRHAIDAVALLAARGCDVELQLIGDGEDHDVLLERSRRAGLQSRVEFIGPLPHDEVLARYRSVDLLIAPSVPSSDGRREGIPTVLMEAMAAGVPVVASDLAGIPELVDDGSTGLLVPPGDSQGLADAIERLARDADLYQALASAGRERVVAEFSIGATSLVMADLIGGCGRGTTPEPGSGSHAR